MSNKKHRKRNQPQKRNCQWFQDDVAPELFATKCGKFVGATVGSTDWFNVMNLYKHNRLAFCCFCGGRFKFVEEDQ